MKECELCEKPAKMHCESDQASLCWDCDARVHGANFLVARHTRCLLCRACQAPTPWKAAGARLAPTVSVCERCESGATDERRENDEEAAGDGEEEEEEEDCDDSQEEEDEEEEEEDGENQVVPWTMTPPPVASSSSSDECSSRFLKRKRENADLPSSSQDDFASPPEAPAGEEATSLAGVFPKKAHFLHLGDHRGGIRPVDLIASGSLSPPI